jgi:omega-6 fatty acid desaturase (delta-12 desaturase)
VVSQSWWHVAVTFTLLIAALVGAGLAPWWQVRAMLSIFAALLMVRTFITYHDYILSLSAASAGRTVWLYHYLCFQYLHITVTA